MPIVAVTIPSDADALIARYQGAGAIVRGLIRQAMDEENLDTVSHILATKLTAAGPRFLNVRTGRLRRSIRASAAVISGSTIKSSIGSNVVYAAAHEFGAKSHKIVARNGKALRFTPAGASKPIFRRSVTVPALPARAPIGTGVAECVPNYGVRIGALIRREFGRN